MIADLATGLDAVMTGIAVAGIVFFAGDFFTVVANTGINVGFALGCVAMAIDAFL